MPRAKQETLHMTFAKAERLPSVGDTVVMQGFYVNYAVTVHRITRREEVGQYVHLTARCTRRALMDTEQEERP